MLAGRHAGKKAMIVKQYDDGKKVNLVENLNFLGQEVFSCSGCWN